MPQKTEAPPPTSMFSLAAVGGTVAAFALIAPSKARLPRSPAYQFTPESCATAEMVEAQRIASIVTMFTRIDSPPLEIGQSFARS